MPAALILFTDKAGTLNWLSNYPGFEKEFPFGLRLIIVTARGGVWLLYWVKYLFAGLDVHEYLFYNCEGFVGLLEEKLDWARCKKKSRKEGVPICWICVRMKGPCLLMRSVYSGEFEKRNATGFENVGLLTGMKNIFILQLRR